MCNLYDIGPKPARLSKSWKDRVAAALDGVPKIYGIRRTDPGIVARWSQDSRSVEPSVMRWGFHRNFSSSINNARLDKLEGGMWSKAWREGRCVIPVAAFYEWSGTKGAKQTHAFLPEEIDEQSSGDSDWLWMAGLWESTQEFGDCFSMITAPSRGVVEPIHHRMPAILKAGAVEEFLSLPADQISTDWLTENLESRLRTFQCLNPLKTATPGPPVEDLFLF